MLNQSASSHLPEATKKSIKRDSTSMCDHWEILLHSLLHALQKESAMVRSPIEMQMTGNSQWG